MSNEGFFRRWARLKSEGGAAEAVAETPRAPAPPADAAPVAARAPGPARQDQVEARQAPLPTLEDAARLTPDADFSAFVAKGVDKSVQRLALKKLFADPHFNAIDGLDMYMNDYNKAAPLPPGMLASLKHAPGVLSRLLDDQQKAAEAAGATGAADTAATAETAEAAEEASAAHAHSAHDGLARGQEHPQVHEHVPPSTRQGNA